MYGAILGAVVAFVVAMMVGSDAFNATDSGAAVGTRLAKPATGPPISLAEIHSAAGGGALLGGCLSYYCLGDLLIGVAVGVVGAAIVAAGRLGASVPGFFGALLVGATLGQRGPPPRPPGSAPLPGLAQSGT